MIHLRINYLYLFFLIFHQQVQQQGKNHNHKPMFTNCSMYAAVVKEEEPAGTVVIQVHAEDQDPPDEGGK